eukprot:3593014-Pleurochrysis_carterae.AAC.1
MFLRQTANTHTAGHSNTETDTFARPHRHWQTRARTQALGNRRKQHTYDYKATTKSVKDTNARTSQCTWTDHAKLKEGRVAQTCSQTMPLPRPR